MSNASLKKALELYPLLAPFHTQTPVELEAGLDTRIEMNGEGRRIVHKGVRESLCSSCQERVMNKEGRPICIFFNGTENVYRCSKYSSGDEQ